MMKNMAPPPPPAPAPASASAEQSPSSSNKKMKNKTNSKNGKKRKIGGNKGDKRGGLSLEERHQEEKSERFSRLEYYASKLIRKEGKVVRAFECRKIAKKSSNSKKQPTLSLEEAKAFDLEQLVQVCLKRLGITHHQPQEQQKMISNSTDETSENDETGKTHVSDSVNEKSSTKELSDLEMNFMEKILQHKKIVTVQETLAKKLADYIEWDKQRQTWINSKRLDTNDDSDQNHPKKKKRKKNANRNDEDDNDVSALFVDSLSGAIAGEDQNHEYGNDYYNNDDEYFEDFDQPKKKNRRGQRARKAKALAIEAKKAGRVYDSSINWRPKKAKKSKEEDSSNATNSNASGLRKNTKTKIADVAVMGKSWKEEGKAHPSWAAREAQKEKSGIGIVQFTGKKITFD